MAFERVSWLPIITVILLLSTVMITFYVSRALGHVTYLLPYISDGGAIPPESCIFGQLLNIIALLLVAVMYVRYRQIRELLSRNNFTDSDIKRNHVALIVGYVACLGCSLVANFQETNIIVIHWFGAGLTFGVGSLYMTLQSMLSVSIYPIQGSKPRNVLKWILSVIGVITFIIFWIGALISIPRFKGDMLKWKREDGFFEYHLASSIAEWICAGCTATYIFLLHYDFKDIKMSEPIIIMYHNLGQSLDYRQNNRY